MTGGDLPGSPLDPLEAEAITEALIRLRDRPPPNDPSSAGCVVAIVALIALVLMPFLDRAFDLQATTLLMVGGGLLGTAVVGGLLGIFGGGWVSGAAIAEVEKALDELLDAHAAGAEDRMRDAAVRLLDGASVTRGPTTVSAFDPGEVAERLGPALEYVRRVERFLLDRKEIYPVFTSLRDGGPE